MPGGPVYALVELGHTLSLPVIEQVGDGRTVIVNVLGVPKQLTGGNPGVLFVYTGVTVTVATTGEVPVFIAVNAGIFPVPLAPSPILVLLLVQLKEVTVSPTKFTGPAV